MSTSEPEQSYVPGEAARRLFYTDSAGEPCGPDDAIADALDGAWVEREPEAAALLADETAEPYDRYLALSALVAWGSPTGYAAVAQAAADPDAVAWKEESIDRLFSVDNTFALLAQAVSDSLDMAQERGTTAERIAALTALLGLADRFYFERYLSVQGLLTADIAELRGPIEEAVRRGLGRVEEAQETGFDLATQVAGLIVDLGQVDGAAAVAYAHALLATDPGSRAERELAPVLQ
ncbi:hypothetical protein KGA66_01715 [Actinocrinis puniceicyclus]|uniref:Uncharacterized protein n=1 Tax=Actinocrinis puniceicyclus TaxID=977794 RepID=A0A8J8B9E4_9ACTN|nr:hypothetical protein [Actinocrinis puniceicyclus]MBS2961747.1 hypothetical protein [Actinocrinis puniceicyclus]